MVFTQMVFTRAPLLSGGRICSRNRVGRVPTPWRVAQGAGRRTHSTEEQLDFVPVIGTAGFPAPNACTCAFWINPNVDVRSFSKTFLGPVDRLAKQAVELVSPQGILPTDTVASVGATMAIDIIASLIAFCSRPNEDVCEILEQSRGRFERRCP